MFSPDDTIVAMATPPGRGAIGVVRISGACAGTVVSAIVTRRAPLAPRVATLTRVRRTSATGESATLDTVVVTSFPAPHSYTGQDLVELSAHGSPVVLQSIVTAAMQAGARLARPGEFTLRAFLNGRIDLVQAESVADLIAAATPLQARAAFDQLEGTLTERIAAADAELFDVIARLEASLDFPDEGYHFISPNEISARVAGIRARVDELIDSGRRGRVIRDGATVVIAGRPNVGKSSMFNALAGLDRAIVTPIPGTTRDLITEQVDIGGLLVTLVDTAGAHEALDAVEREGVMRGARAREVADLVLLVVDGSVEMMQPDEELLRQTASRPRIVVANKSDLGLVSLPSQALRVSAATGEGIEQLRQTIVQSLTGGESLHDTATVTNTRHLSLLDAARASLERARVAAAAGAVTEEFILADLLDARARFDEIVGKRTADDVLRHIFERFCIGK
jgi:tRNA modification GTPase